ncbi:MAG: hypothetical protein AAGF87_00140 [Bacteroidota bacterium]
MQKSVKLLLAFILCTVVLTQEKVCEHLGFGRAAIHQQLADNYPPVETKGLVDVSIATSSSPVNSPTLEEPSPNLEITREPETIETHFTSTTYLANTSAKPVEIRWDFLTNIEYELKYFEELEMEIYVPVFTDEHKALDGQEVLIEGYVIPFDLDGEFLSLSANPYASCFFCGQASPASVISLYLKSDRVRYSVDDFKKFRGTLHLNYDDPNEFYYILRDAVEG